MNKTQFAKKRYKDRIKRMRKHNVLIKKRTKQLGKTHTVSQHMYEKGIEEDIRNHEFDMEKSRISSRKKQDI